MMWMAKGLEGKESGVDAGEAEAGGQVARVPSDAGVMGEAGSREAGAKEGPGAVMEIQVRGPSGLRVF